METNKILAFILAVIIVIVASIILTALFVWIVCVCFGVTFSWKLAVGIWAIQILLNMTFAKASKN